MQDSPREDQKKIALKPESDLWDVQDALPAASHCLFIKVRRERGSEPPVGDTQCEFTAEQSRTLTSDTESQLVGEVAELQKQVTSRDARPRCS